MSEQPLQGSESRFEPIMKDGWQLGWQRRVGQVDEDGMPYVELRSDGDVAHHDHAQRLARKRVAAYRARHPKESP